MHERPQGEQGRVLQSGPCPNQNPRSINFGNGQIWSNMWTSTSEARLGALEGQAYPF